MIQILASWRELIRELEQFQQLYKQQSNATIRKYGIKFYCYEFSMEQFNLFCDIIQHCFGLTHPLVLLDLAWYKKISTCNIF